MPTHRPGYPTTHAEVQSYRTANRERRKAARHAEDQRLAAWGWRFDMLPALEREALEARARVRLARFLRDAPPESHARMIRHQAIALLQEGPP